MERKIELSIKNKNKNEKDKLLEWNSLINLDYWILNNSVYFKLTKWQLIYLLKECEQQVQDQSSVTESSHTEKD